jgi:hypothetical protein
MYRVAKDSPTSVNFGLRTYRPGEEVPTEAVEKVDPKNIKLLLAQGILEQDGVQVPQVVEATNPPLPSSRKTDAGDAPVKMRPSESPVRPAELAQELIEERGNDGAPLRTEAEVLAEMEEKMGKKAVEVLNDEPEDDDDEEPDDEELDELEDDLIDDEEDEE